MASRIALLLSCEATFCKLLPLQLLKNIYISQPMNQGNASACLKLGIVWSREDCEQAASGGDVVDGEALAHVREVVPAAARIRALMRPQNQPQPIGFQEFLYKEGYPWERGRVT